MLNSCLTAMIARPYNSKMSKTEVTKNDAFDRQLIHKALDHIETKWHDLRRVQPEDKGTLIGLPYPYIVPSSKTGSGFMFEEMYYWDSYFIAQGLMKSHHRRSARNMLENLLYLARRFDIVPNANRFYLMGRSQPPLLSSFILDIHKQRRTKDMVWLQDSMAIAQREYAVVWLGTQHPNWRNVFHGLSRYYDVNVHHSLAEAESGWDMTTRFGDKCLSFVPIDLNALLYKYEMDFAEYSDLVGDEGSREQWKAKARERAEMINAFMWDEEKGYYFDYNYVDGVRSKVWSVAGLYALWTGLATEHQAERIVKNLDKFLLPGGLSTTAAPRKPPVHEEKYNHQWAYPNGWAPLHWIAVKGLERYGYAEEAEKIAKLWLKTNLIYFREHGVFREAYNVAETTDTPQPGVYPPQLGFGWTNGVFVDLAQSYLPGAKQWLDRAKPKKPAVEIMLQKMKHILEKPIQSIKEPLHTIKEKTRLK